MDERLGKVVGERFRLLELIGSGGAGRVYRAEQLDLEREVAVKLVDTGSRINRVRERFRLEARATSAIEHPGVVVIYDFGSWGSELYLAMELLSGESLEAELRGGPLDGARAAQLLSQVGEALDAAHQAGVLHRDLKPSNIMLAGGPGSSRVKLVDFGLALLRSSSARLTAGGRVAGSPAYMSPEQCRGQELDERSDVYSLGVVLYELLCGQLPFDEGGAAEVLIEQMYRDPQPPSRKSPGLSIDPALEALALWALAKDPAARPPGALAFTRELRRATAGIRGEGAAQRADTPADAPALVVLERTGGPFASSLSACLRANDLAAATAADLEDAAVAGAEVLVVDLRRRAGQLEELVARGLTERCQVVVVGPDDAELMRRAIEVGAADYVPASVVNSRLARSIRRIERRVRRAAAARR